MRVRKGSISEIIATILFFGFACIGAQGATIHVPADYSTIQAAINAASNGDTIVVAPGTYQENIDFQGKAITVMSSGGSTVTTIDGGKTAPVVVFDTNEGATSILQGFTITNGYGTFASSYDGGGIYVSGASPTIKGNTITDNEACAGAASA